MQLEHVNKKTSVTQFRYYILYTQSCDESICQILRQMCQILRQMSTEYFNIQWSEL